MSSNEIRQADPSSDVDESLVAISESRDAMSPVPSDIEQEYEEEEEDDEYEQDIGFQMQSNGLPVGAGAATIIDHAFLRGLVSDQEQVGVAMNLMGHGEQGRLGANDDIISGIQIQELFSEESIVLGVETNPDVQNAEEEEEEEEEEEKEEKEEEEEEPQEEKELVEQQEERGTGVEAFEEKIIQGEHHLAPEAKPKTETPAIKKRDERQPTRKQTWQERMNDFDQGHSQRDVTKEATFMHGWRTKEAFQKAATSAVPGQQAPVQKEKRQEPTKARPRKRSQHRRSPATTPISSDLSNDFPPSMRSNRKQKQGESSESGSERPRRTRRRDRSPSWEADSHQENSDVRIRKVKQDIIIELQDLYGGPQRLKESGITMDTPLNDLQFYKKKKLSSKDEDDTMVMYRDLAGAAFGMIEKGNRTYIGTQVKDWGQFMKEELVRYDRQMRILHRRYAVRRSSSPIMDIVMGIILSLVAYHFTMASTGKPPEHSDHVKTLLRAQRGESGTQRKSKKRKKRKKHRRKRNGSDGGNSESSDSSSDSGDLSPPPESSNASFSSAKGKSSGEANPLGNMLSGLAGGMDMSSIMGLFGQMMK
jgi:hypothetical protein